MKYRIVRLNNGIYRLEYKFSEREDGLWFKFIDCTFLWQAKRHMNKKIKERQADPRNEAGFYINSVVIVNETDE